MDFLDKKELSTENSQYWRRKQIQWDKWLLQNKTNKTVAVVNKICLLYSARKNEDKQTDCNQLYYSGTITMNTCFRHSQTVHLLCTYISLQRRALLSLMGKDYVQYATGQTGQSKRTGLMRSGFTDLSMDSNELLGVTFCPWRQLYISQSGTILHAAYRDKNTY